MATALVAASNPATAPSNANSKNWVSHKRRALAPSARSTAASRLRSVALACTAAVSTAIPANSVNMKTYCTATLTCWMICRTCCIRESISNRVTDGNCWIRRIVVSVFSAGRKKLVMSVLGRSRSKPGVVMTKKLTSKLSQATSLRLLTRPVRSTPATRKVISSPIPTPRVCANSLSSDNRCSSSWSAVHHVPLTMRLVSGRSTEGERLNSRAAKR